MWVLDAKVMGRKDPETKECQVHKRMKLYLTAGEYMVGRDFKKSAIVLENATISGAHMKLFVHELSEADLKAEHGLQRIEVEGHGRTPLQIKGVEVPNGERVAISDGDEIILVNKAGARLVVRYQPIIVCTATRYSSKDEQYKLMMADMKKAARKVGAVVHKHWSPQCTHYVPEIPVLVSIKLLQAVIKAVPIVSNEWLLKVSELSGPTSELPAVTDFRPRWRNVELKSPEQNRLGFYRDLFFIVLVKDELEDVLLDAGAQVFKAFELDDESFLTEDFMTLTGEGRYCVVLEPDAPKKGKEPDAAALASLKMRKDHLVKMGAKLIPKNKIASSLLGMGGLKANTDEYAWRPTDGAASQQDGSAAAQSQKPAVSQMPPPPPKRQAPQKPTDSSQPRSPGRSAAGAVNNEADTAPVERRVKMEVETVVVVPDSPATPSSDATTKGRKRGRSEDKSKKDDESQRQAKDEAQGGESVGTRSAGKRGKAMAAQEEQDGREVGAAVEMEVEEAAAASGVVVAEEEEKNGGRKMKKAKKKSEDDEPEEVVVDEAGGPSSPSTPLPSSAAATANKAQEEEEEKDHHVAGEDNEGAEEGTESNQQGDKSQPKPKVVAKVIVDADGWMTSKARFADRDTKRDALFSSSQAARTLPEWPSSSQKNKGQKGKEEKRRKGVEDLDPQDEDDDDDEEEMRMGKTQTEARALVVKRPPSQYDASPSQSSGVADFRRFRKNRVRHTRAREVVTRADMQVALARQSEQQLLLKMEEEEERGSKRREQEEQMFDEDDRAASKAAGGGRTRKW